MGSCYTSATLTPKPISDFSVSSAGKVCVNHCLNLGHLYFFSLKLPSTASTEAARQEVYIVTGKDNGLLLAQAQCRGFMSSETKAFTKKVI